jgi:uncharacterized protein YhaN
LRFLDLHLKAFGPFTDRRLDLSGGEEGLQLVFGPNEAGKSSALRALKALLYGFPARSGDDFLHPYDQLRVGARLRFADGAEIEMLRRKGKKSTLLTADGETPLADSDGLRLDRCLQGIDEALFSSLFGLDHAALVAGGEELLAQKGDVGQALFAAGLGTRNLRQVLDGLDAEADALFLPRGSKPRINQAIAEHKEAKRTLAELSLSGREWEGKRKELETKRADSAALTGDLAVQKAERNRLQRIRRVQARLGERRDLLLRRAELGEVVALPADFGESWRQAREALRAAVDASIRAGSQIAEVRQEAAALTVARAVLDQAETVERLHQGVALFTKGIADRSRLLGEHGELRATAERLLDDLRPGLTLAEAETLRPALDRWLRIQELGNQRQALWNEWASAAAESAAAERRLGAARDDFAALPVLRDVSRLRRLLVAARKSGDLDREIAVAADVLVRDEEQLLLDLGRLGLWRGTPEALEALPVPGEETLRRFAEDSETLAGRRRTLAEQLRALHAELAEAERRLDEIQRSGAIPSEEEMLAARDRRAAHWSLVRRAWLEGDEAVTADPAAYERSVAEADDLADRLRREAGRVEEQAQLRARREQQRRAAAALETEATRAAAEAVALTAAWKSLWQPCGIAPLPPREMHPAWTRRHEKLRARAETLRAERRRLEGLRATREEHRATLVHELAAAGVPLEDRGDRGDRGDGERLEPVLAVGEERVQALEREAAERVRITAAGRDAEAHLAAAREAAAAARAALERWQTAWAEAIQGLGLDRDALPSEAVQIVETLRRAFASVGDAAKLDRRVSGIERDLETFRASVRALAHQVAPELAGHPAEQAAVQLQALLTEARRRSDRREALDRRTAKLEDEVRTAEATRRTMEDRLARLVQEAGCADASGLEAAERRSVELADVLRDLARTERQLQADGEGLTLADLEAEAGGIEADVLPGRIEQLDSEIEELEARLRDLREELGEGQEELRHLTGGENGASRQAERAQEILAELGENVRRYTRARLAAIVLRREIERYRAENQDPLLSRAGERFTTLTLGRYTGLRSDFDDRDEPILVGVRQDDRRVRVERMSDGTRDQLYLALRLATLERYLAQAGAPGGTGNPEPLPFVVDDILINFDDERSAATLTVLAELAARTQVILFTHHAHLRDLAAGLKNGAGVFVRELG